MQDDPLVEHPTWFGQIRHFFTEADVAHMAAKSIDLGTYNGVVAIWDSIYAQTESGSMPPDPLPKWSANKVQTFLNWANDNFPMGTPEPAPAPLQLAELAGAPRLRRNLADLDPGEIATLKRAFAGIMARDPAQPDSYFAIAGVHWFPAIDQNPQFHCLHHENRFLAWHRFHLLRFEDALRSVPDCGDVTLPYWDVTTPIPALLYEEPFASYALQGPIGHGYDPLTTSRYTAAEIAANLGAFRVADAIAAALRQATWEQFNRTFWGAHDNGHVACGTTMENQDISAFDPVFWFFHCNLDRIWLDWQRLVGATTLAGFKSTCRDSTAWLDLPALRRLPPFAGTAPEAVTLAEVDYDSPQQEALAMQFENKSGNVPAAGIFRIDGESPLSIRVKDVDRSAIPGTFVIHLLADGEEVARQAFFQPTDPGVCPNCSENAKVAIDFQVEAERVVDRDLSIEIHVPGQRDIGTRFPLSRVGAPTINVRHLLEGE